MYIERRTALKKAQLFGILERLCEWLEPSPTQADRAKTSYEAVGQWIAGGEGELLASSSIYLQGSTALGTTVKPIGRNEYDVDLVCHIPALSRWLPPALCKQLVGDRLKESQRYRAMLEEKPRCWRLNYANEFHLDITPSIPNDACVNRGELVPDKALRCWKATNPKGYRDAFQRRAELVPQMRLLKSFAEDGVRADADIEPFPERPRFKGLLCRIVQIAKRHRDTFFLSRDAALAPISVIITTLAAWSYEYCVRSAVFDSELDVLSAVIRHMPDFIGRQVVAGRVEWFIWNETTEGENFAERWNADPAHAKAFFDWHAAAMADLERLTQSEGLDRLSEVLTESFGQEPTAEVMHALFASVFFRRAANWDLGACRIGRPDDRAYRRRNIGPGQHLLRSAVSFMQFNRPRPLTVAQQYLNLRANPACAGKGRLHGNMMSWHLPVTPTPFSRCYTARLEYRQDASPQVFIDGPDLTVLADGRRLPHVYEQAPTRLCLFLPGSGEWGAWMRLDQTIVPWTALWLLYFEEWLFSGEWAGGGLHPIVHERARGRGRRKLDPCAQSVGASS